MASQIGIGPLVDARPSRRDRCPRGRRGAALPRRCKRPSGCATRRTPSSRLHRDKARRPPRARRESPTATGTGYPIAAGAWDRWFWPNTSAHDTSRAEDPDAPFSNWSFTPEGLQSPDWEKSRGKKKQAERGQKEAESGPNATIAFRSRLPFRSFSVFPLRVFPSSPWIWTLRTSRGSRNLSYHYFIIVLAIWMPAGPTRTTKTPGKMNRTSGIMILTAVFAARSSASCRRLVRIESD